MPQRRRQQRILVVAETNQLPSGTDGLNVPRCSEPSSARSLHAALHGLTSKLVRICFDPSNRTLKRIAPLIHRLERQRQDLQHCAASVESQFLTVGSILEELSRLSDQLVSQGETLLLIATGKAEAKAILLSTVQIMEPPLAFIDTANHTFTEWLTRFEEFDSKIDAILRTEHLLQRTLAPLRMIQTLFKVETTTLEPEVQRMFLALIADIERLHGQVTENFGSRFKPLQQTKEALAHITKGLRQSIRLNGAFASEKRASIHASINTLERDLDANSKLDIRLNQTTGSIAKDVNEVVVGMQYQDITDQRIQHVDEALQSIRDRSVAAGHRASPQEKQAALSFIHHAASIQAAQLQGVTKNLDNAESQITNAIQNILKTLENVDAGCLDLREFEQHTTSSEGMVQVLLNTIQETRDLLTVTTKHIEDAHHAIEPLGGLTSNLTGTVRKLSFEIQLIGLNAQVQAALIGSGTGLEVLSAHISDISRETSRISDQAAQELDAVAELLREGVTAFGALGESSRNERSVFDSAGKTQEDRLHGFRDKALQTLSAVSELLSQVKTKASNSLQSIQFGEGVMVCLGNLERTLHDIQETILQYYPKEQLEAHRDQATSEIKRNYTMAAEHDVFEAASRVSLLPKSPHPNTATLIHPTLPASSPPQPSQTPVQSPTSPINPIATSTAATNSALGDNVELF